MKIYNLIAAFMIFFCFASFGAESIVITFVTRLSAIEIKELERTFSGSLELLSSVESDYFKRTYTFTFEKNDNSKKIIKDKRVESAEDTIQINSSSIIQAVTASTLSNDPLLSYQWGVDITDQKVLNEVNDLENIEIPSIKTADIEVKSLDEITSKMKRDVIVAVIDTGVDFTHPDLKESIFINEAECNDGEIIFEAKEDRDGNGFKGDCKGWNFTTEKEGSNRPEDFVGHGTHLAGIIAATRNNNLGISGISNKIKILPIKALASGAAQGKGKGTSDRLAKAITYAVSMNVDVINLSLGWPLSFDKKHLREAVNLALKEGIAVVAAAGNNDNSEPIFPCAYDGVLCVGSNDPDGGMSDFSNFGGHVDVLAPGNNILSTSPLARTPNFFDQKGYEIASGTSQSAPYVSALAAVLKGITPDISPLDIKSRIYNGTRAGFNAKLKYSVGGLINFEKSINNKVIDLVRPNFKNLSRVKVHYTEREFSFELKVINYGETAVKKTIELKLEGAMLEESLLLIELKAKEEKRIKVSGKIKDLSTNYFKMLTVSINNEVFKNQLRFFVDYEQIPNKIVKIIEGKKLDELTKLKTINYNHAKVEKPGYYFSKNQKNGLMFMAYEVIGDKVKRVGVAVIPDTERILSVHRLDANQDGKLDYLIRSLAKDTSKEEEGIENKNKTFQYTYLDNKLRPLFFKKEVVDGRPKLTNYSNIQINFEQVIVENLDDFALYPYEHKELGRILVPVFYFVGKKPEADKNPNPFARLRRRSFSANIYYYEPVLENDKVRFVTRSLNTIKFNEAVKKRIGYKAFNQIFVMKFYKQSFSEIKDGEFKLLLSLEGRSRVAQNFILKVTSLQDLKWEIKNIPYSNVSLSDYVIERSVDLSHDYLGNHGNNRDIIANTHISNLSWEQIFYNKSGGELGIHITNQEKKNEILRQPIQTYSDIDTFYRFYLTPSKIYFEVNSLDKTEKFDMPIHVTSFLQELSFSEQRSAIVRKGIDRNYPALYIDATQITTRNIYTVTTEGGELFAPISLNLNVPEKCKARNPQVLNGEYHYTLRCISKDNKTVKMVYIPVRL